METFYLFYSAILVLFCVVLFGLLVLEWRLQRRWIECADPSIAKARRDFLTRLAVSWCWLLTLLQAFISFRQFEDLAGLSSSLAYGAQAVCNLLPVAGMGWLGCSLWMAGRPGPAPSAPFEAQRALLGAQISMAAVLCTFLGARASELMAILFDTPALPHVGGAVREYAEMIPVYQIGANTQAFTSFQVLAGFFSVSCGLAILRSVFIFDPEAQRRRIRHYRNEKSWYPLGIWLFAAFGLYMLAHLMLELPASSAARVVVQPMRCAIDIAFCFAAYLLFLAESQTIVRARRTPT